jgi:membrane protein
MRLAQMRSFFQTAFDKWQRDDCLTLGASLSYYALFSFFPLILVILSVVGALIDPGKFAVRQQLLALIGSDQVRDLVTETLANLNKSSVGAGLIGFITLLLAASGIFGALDKAFDQIWETRATKPAGAGIVATAWGVVRQKLLAFGLVLGCAVIMLLSIASTVAVSALSRFTSALPGQALAWQAIQFALSLGLLGLAFGMLFKLMPNRKVHWRDVWLAAIVAALLFAALQKVVGIYLSRTNYASYGAVGGVMALMLWIYLSSLVVLLGGVLSYAYARTFGSLAVK